MSTLWWVLVFGACAWLVSHSVSTKQPSSQHQAPQLYSNQVGQDLRHTLTEAIQRSVKSVHLVMFGLSDPSLLQALSSRHVPTKIYYDPNGSPNLWDALPFAELHPVHGGGLMHQKILVCDQETVFIGSANMTTASLSMHDNLMIGLKSPLLARFLIDKPPGTPGYFRTSVGGQDVEVWLLPDPRGHALLDLRKKIRSAKRSLQIALFTLTHPILIDEIIHAHRRGILVMPIIDMHSGLGASKKAVDLLKRAGIRILLSKGVQLLHHKFILIDGEMLVTGSANWTKAAFYKNSDCFFVLHNLNKEQKAFMERLWDRIESEARPIVQKKKEGIPQLPQKSVFRRIKAP